MVSPVCMHSKYYAFKEEFVSSAAITSALCHCNPMYYVATTLVVCHYYPLNCVTATSVLCYCYPLYYVATIPFTLSLLVTGIPLYDHDNNITDMIYFTHDNNSKESRAEVGKTAQFVCSVAGPVDRVILTWYEKQLLLKNDSEYIITSLVSVLCINGTPFV